MCEVIKNIQCKGGVIPLLSLASKQNIVHNIDPNKMLFLH